MNKKLFIFGLTILVISAMVFVVISCNKDSLSNKTDEQLSMRDSRISKIQIYDIRKAFAKTLMIAMREEPALRSFLKNKCIIADTSNYELVYLSLKDNTVTRGLTFSQILAIHAPEDVLRTFGGNFFNQLVNDVPLLTISFPDMDNVHLNDWTTSTVPDVAAVSTINLKSFTLFSADNSSVNELTLSDGQMEDDVINRPVLAIYDAEIHYLINEEGITFDGTDIDSLMPRGFGNSPNNNRYDCWKYWFEAQSALEETWWITVDGVRRQFYLVEHGKLLKAYYECLGITTTTGSYPPPSDKPCQRDYEEYDEHLMAFRLSKPSVHKAIKNQVFEIYFIFHADMLGLTRNSFGTVGTYNVKYVSPPLEKWDLYNMFNGITFWIKPNFRFYTDWKLDVMGSPYQVKWAEVDGGTTTFNLKFGLAAEFKVGSSKVTGSGEIGYSYTGSQVVDLGSQSVYYCDVIGKINDTGSIQFTCD